MYRKMLKKVLPALFVLGLCFAQVFTAQAATVKTADQDYRNQVFKVCGINDLTALDQPMTRGEFAKMLVMCSAQKDTIANSNAAASADVPASDPNAKYVRIALKNNWMRNRLGGKFDPNGTVTLTDGAKAALTMLGYTDQDFAGNVNGGRLAMLASLGLNEGVNATGAYDPLTVQECINLMYNALKTKQKQGGDILGSGISLTLSSDGSLNATNVLDNTMKGPILIKNYKEIQENLPFAMSEAEFYYNGTLTSIYSNLQLLSYSSQLENNGWLILYYNEASKSVWGYGKDTGNNAYHCIRGTVQRIYYESDNIAAPSSIIVDDTTYQLGSSDVKFMFSVNGTISVGDSVILICKQNSQSESEESMSNYVVTGVMMYRKKE